MQSSLPPFDFSNKKALVTGGTSGIGLGIAKGLASAGATVGVLGRDEAKAKRASESCQRDGAKGQAVPLCCDVRDAEALAKVVEDFAQNVGELDIVVSGAAGNFPAPVAKLSANGFKSVVDIDLLGSYHTAKAVYPHLKRPGATLLHISAPQAMVPAAFQAHVCAAKAGVDMLTRTLALEWGREGIRINSIVPGPIKGTEGMDRLAPGEQMQAMVAKGIPLGRLGTTTDIAQLAAFLCSDFASYIHGAVIPCDGGQVLVGFAPFTAMLSKMG